MVSSSEMVASGIDDLIRAASAAGYAMAGEDDETTVTARPKTASEAVSIEDSARGARSVIVAAVPVAADASYIPKTVRDGASSVRDTVYGYLRFGGAPA